MLYMHRSEDGLLGSVLSFFLVGSRDPTHVVKVDSKCHNLLSYLTSPGMMFLNARWKWKLLMDSYNSQTSNSASHPKLEMTAFHQS